MALVKNVRVLTYVFALCRPQNVIRTNDEEALSPLPLLSMVVVCPSECALYLRLSAFHWLSRCNTQLVVLLPSAARSGLRDHANLLKVSRPLVGAFAFYDRREFVPVTGPIVPVAYYAMPVAQDAGPRDPVMSFP